MSANGDLSSERSSSSTNSDFENSDEACLKCFDEEIQPYAFEPVDNMIPDTDTDGEIDMEVEESSEDSDDENRLQNKDWLVQMLKPSFSLNMSF